MKAMTRGVLGKSSILLVIAMLMMIIAPAYTAEKPSNSSIAISSFSDKAGSININAGKGEGVKTGAKGVVMRGDKQIAEYQVDQINWGWSRISISNLVEGYTVQAGDSAPLTGQTDKSTSIKKKSNTIWIVAAVVAALLLFSKGGGKKTTNSNSTITLFAEKQTTPDSVSVGITAEIKDGNGQSVEDNTPVNFSTTAGQMDPILALTKNGIARSILNNNPAQPATNATITVRALGKSASIPVNFTSNLELAASPTTIQVKTGGGTVTESTITATCHDASGNPATTGTVNFTTTKGTLTDSVGATTDKATIDGNGVATVKLSSDEQGTAIVTARWTGSELSKTITITSGAPTSISTGSSASSLVCDPNSFVTVTATVKDAGNNTVTNGTLVNFSVIPDGSGGGNGTITAQAPTVNGVATAILFGKAPGTSNASNAGTATIKVQVLKAGQPATVAAPAANLTNQDKTVLFISPNVATISVVADPTNIRAWDKIGNTSNITAFVLNASNAPVPDGTVVDFTTNHGGIAGTVTGSTRSLTKDGRATASLVGDASGNGTWNGAVNITASSGGINGHATVIFSGAPLLANCSAVVNPSPANLPSVNGQATILVTAKDLNGNPVADGTKVTANAGRISVTAEGNGTTVGGMITFNLATSTVSSSPTTAGPGTVTITIDPGAQQVVLTTGYTVLP